MQRRSLFAFTTALFVSFIFVDIASAYYNPRTGRFISRDPIGEPGAALIRFTASSGGFVPRDPIGEEHQLYTYVKNSPVRYVDPVGLKKCSPATGSLRCFMEKWAGTYSNFTRSGKPDPDDRITWKILSCIACQESSFDPCAKGTSDDFGLMQLTKTGALEQCKKMGIFKSIDPDEFSEEKRKKCCDSCCQPQCGKNDEGEYEYKRNCCEGCEDSIWNIDNQLKCAAAYLRHLRDGRKDKVTLQMMLCMYNKGEGAEECKSDASAREVPYVKSILECLGGIDTTKPGTDVVSPPSHLN